MLVEEVLLLPALGDARGLERVLRLALFAQPAVAFTVERGNPGAVMCAYNHFNGSFSCGSDFLLNKVLKKDWGYPGFVMSDWGANHATADALAGLDRESGEEFDSQIFFGAPLMALDGKDAAYTARVTDMNQRILRSMIANHLFDDPPRIATPDIARGVDRGSRETQGAGDQGMMFGYASDESKELMPRPIQLAHKLSRKLAAVRKAANGIDFLRPDGKSQVSVRYENDQPVAVDTIVVSTQPK